MNKYIHFNNLNKIRKQYQNKKIILCHGVFDIIHFGHINHFLKAKNFGDILVVTVTQDKFVKKGQNRPYFNINNRIKVIQSLKFVDFVSISENETAIEIIKELKPDFYCKGIEYKNKDYTGNIKKEINELKKNKGKIVFTDEQSSSSSKIINDLFSTLGDENKNLLKKIKSNYNLENIEHIFNKINKKNILVIGETIIDQISDCSIIGNSSKDAHLIVKEENSKKYLGGAASISNYISKFCKVTLLSIVGKDHDSYRIKQNLDKKIKNKIFIEKEGKTILKKRYTDKDNNKKLFGNYDADNCVLSKNNEKKIILYLKKEIKKYDKIVLCDYGHYFISKNILKILTKSKKKVILNSQINAHNFGHHNYLKYKNFEFLVANEKEIRHDLQDVNSKINFLISKFNKKYNFKYLVVSRGSDGLIYFNKNLNKKISYPAFGDKVVDKVGAGDTLLSFISIFFDEKKDNDICFLISSLAAAENIKEYVNSSILDKKFILKKIMHLLS